MYRALFVKHCRIYTMWLWFVMYVRSVIQVNKFLKGYNDPSQRSTWRRFDL